MIIREVLQEDKEQFNKTVTHPLQSWQWGEFREKTGIKVIRIGIFDKKVLKNGFQIFLHPIPKTNKTVGYMPKCTMLTKQVLEALKKIGKEHKSIFIKIEPNLEKGKSFFLNQGLTYGRPLFTKYTFQIDLKKDEPALLSNMKSKTRYNIRLAEKYGVKVVEDNSTQAFNEYLRLTFKTTKRQKFYAHDEDYHTKMWQTLQPAGITHLLKATYKGKILVTWIVFKFNNVLYYPYGASSREHKEVMASNLIMWQAIRFGKKIGCHTFDLWGCLGPNPDKKDPWYGFHRFKQGYGPKLVEFLGTFDYVLNPSLYSLYNLADSLRWKWLKIKTVFG